MKQVDVPLVELLLSFGCRSVGLRDNEYLVQKCVHWIVNRPVPEQEQVSLPFTITKSSLCPGFQVFTVHLPHHLQRRGG